VHDRERSGSPNFQRRRDASAPGHNPYPANQRLCRRHVRSRAERTARRRRLCASTLPPPSTRRTGASPPAPTDHPTRKEKKKERKAGAAPAGSVEVESKPEPARGVGGRASPSSLEIPQSPGRRNRGINWDPSSSSSPAKPASLWLAAAGGGYRRRRAGQLRARRAVGAAEPASLALVLCDDRWGPRRKRAHRTVALHL